MYKDDACMWEQRTACEECYNLLDDCVKDCTKCECYKCEDGEEV